MILNVEQLSAPKNMEKFLRSPFGFELVSEERNGNSLALLENRASTRDVVTGRAPKDKRDLLRYEQ